jgi:hypothetical protein
MQTRERRLYMFNVFSMEGGKNICLPLLEIK